MRYKKKIKCLLEDENNMEKRRSTKTKNSESVGPSSDDAAN